MLPPSPSALCTLLPQHRHHGEVGLPGQLGARGGVGGQAHQRVGAWRAGRGLVTAFMPRAQDTYMHAKDTSVELN